jgi:hypothetical protein
MASFGSNQMASTTGTVRSRYDTSAASFSAVPTVPVDVPRAPIVQATSEVAQGIETVNAIFGLAGQALGAAASVQEGQIRDVERNNAITERANAAIASRHARLDAVRYSEDIAEGKVKVPAGTRADEFAMQLVSRELANTGVSDRDYVDEYRALMEPHLAKTLATKIAADKEVAAKETMAVLADGVYNAKSVENINATVQSAVAQFGVSDRVARASIVVPALKLAAENGETDQFEIIASAIPQGELTGEVKSLRDTANTNFLQQQNKQSSLLAGTITELIDSGAPAEIAEDAIRQGSGVLSPGVSKMLEDRIKTRDTAAQNQAAADLERQFYAAGLNGQIDDQIGAIAKVAKTDPEKATRLLYEFNRGQEQFRKQAIEVDLQQQQETFLSSVVANSNSVPLGTIGDVVFKSGDKEVKLTGNDIRTAAKARIFATIDQTITDPALNISAKINEAAKHALPVPEWQGRLRAPLMSAEQLEQASEAPAYVSEAFGLYRAMRAQQPAFLDSILNDQEKKFYGAAVGALANTNDPLQALRTAQRAINPPAGTIVDMEQRIQTKDIERAATKVGGNNIGDVMSYVRDRAMHYLPGTSADDALAKATADVQAMGTIINGRYTWTSVQGLGTETQKEIPALAKHLIDKYVATQKPERPDSLTFEYNQNRGQWEIIDVLAGAPAPGPGPVRQFGNDQLEKLRLDLGVQGLIDGPVKLRNLMEKIANIPEPKRSGNRVY